MRFFPLYLLVLTMSINAGQIIDATKNSSRICMFGKDFAEMDAQDVKNFLDCAAANFSPNSSGDLPSHKRRAQSHPVMVESVMGTDLISMSAKDLCDIFNLPSDLAHSVVQSISQFPQQKMPHSDNEHADESKFLEDIAPEDLVRCGHSNPFICAGDVRAGERSAWLRS
jgi:hypothetical protein